METLAPGRQETSFNKAVPSAPYNRHAPEPPFIRIPASHRSNIALQPSVQRLDSTLLTIEDLRIITNNKVQLAKDTTSSWSYEKRRLAQQMLDYLWLGPTSVVKDLDFLRREGITMVLVARDARLSVMRNRSIDKAAQELGIVVEYIDVDGHQQLLSKLAEVIRLINGHLLQLYRSQMQQTGSGQVVQDFVPGKVLVTCETGNDASCAIVAAYIMAMFGKNMITAIQFINMNRFCSNFDPNAKRMLQTWGDILKARSAVAREQPAVVDETQPSRRSRSMKRRADEMDLEDEDVDMDASHADTQRFMGREAFVPFLDDPES